MVIGILGFHGKIFFITAESTDNRHARVVDGKNEK